MPTGIDLSPLEAISSWEDMFNKINELVDSINQDLHVLSTLEQISEGQKASYTSSDNVYITGEIFRIVTPGVYTVSSVGAGEIRYLIQNASTGSTTTYIGSNNYTSSGFYLSTDDLIYFYATASSGDTITISLTLTQSIFSLIQDLSNRVRNVESELTTAVQEITNVSNANRAIVEANTEILENFTQQYNGISAQIVGLDNRIRALEE